MVELVARELGDRFFGTVVVDQGFAGGSGSDECRDGGVVQCAWQTEASFVQPSDGIVGDQGIGSTNQGQMMAQVLGRLGQVHGCQLIACGDPLVEGGKHAEP